MTQNGKNQILDQLSITYNRTNLLKIISEEQGNLIDAKKFEIRKKRLKTEIDELIQNLLQEWIGDAKQLKIKIINSNSEISKSIKDIQSKIKLAENIVKALGFIDDAIQLAANLFP